MILLWRRYNELAGSLYTAHSLFFVRRHEVGDVRGDVPRARLPPRATGRGLRPPGGRVGARRLRERSKFNSVLFDYSVAGRPLRARARGRVARAAHGSGGRRGVERRALLSRPAVEEYPAVVALRIARKEPEYVRRAGGEICPPLLAFSPS